MLYVTTTCKDPRLYKTRTAILMLMRVAEGIVQTLPANHQSAKTNTSIICKTI